MIGRTISHYKILEKIGEGGMGVVYKAEDTKLDRLVALKFLPKQFSINEEEKKRFILEAKAAASLDHSNICAVYEINETDDGQMFIAMAYYEGETLKEKIEKGPLKTNKVIDLAIQLSEGLHEAHANKIIHRDIKSANIIITNKGQVKILDFGLAKLRGQTKLTKESTTLGTVNYMSPEQTTGDQIDQRTDIWSLGVVFYEMLTGQLPFKGHYEQAIVYSILNEKPQPLKELIPEVPVQLEQIINKMLAKDPSQRYPDLGDFLENIKRFKKGKELKEISPKPGYKIIPTPKSMVVGVILIAAIIIGAFFIFKGKTEIEIPPVEPGSQPSLAVVYFENKSGDEKLDNWRDAFSQLLTTDLSQSRYIKVLRSDEVYGIFKKLNLLEAKRYSTQDLKDVARNGKVNHVLKGSYIKAGDKFVITAMLINASSGDTISSLSVRAEGEKDIFPKVDELTREIKSKLELTADQIAGDVDKEVGQIITSSPEAFEYFMQGGRSLELGEYRKSIAFLEKAVAIDPEFAMAYHYMSHAYVYSGEVSEGKKYRKKALKFSHRLPDRQRYYIEAGFNYDPEKNWDKKIEAYNKILQLYPLDLTASAQLGHIYRQLEEWDQAIEKYDVWVRKKTDNPNPYICMALCYQSKGFYEKARKILEYYLKNFQDYWDIRVSLAGNYCLQNKFDRALVEAEKAISLAPKRIEPQKIKAYIYFYQGHFSKALKASRKLLEHPEKFPQFNLLQQIGYIHMTRGQFKEAEACFREILNRTKKVKWEYYDFFIAAELGILYFSSGKFNECLKEFNKILAAPKDWNISVIKPYVLYFTALVYLKQKSWALAEKIEAELLEWVNNQKNKKLIRWYYLFRGQKELKNKNLAGAIDYFKKAVSLLFYENDNIYGNPQLLFFDALARAYLESGNLDKARNLFEKITAFTTGRFHFGDIYARAFYQLGKIYQQKGIKDKAIDNFNKFIELWKNCDPIFQLLVMDAKEQVKILESGV